MKRIIDVFVSTVALVLFSPVLLILFIQVRRKLGSPALFRQKRPGLKGEEFEMVKFRTMTDARDENGELLPDEERTHTFGTWLRSTSLDELPELWNVICGKMSLVGPRPLLTEYLPLYSERQARRHEVRPGLTGWAQVNGRNSSSWKERLEMDAWYVENRSLWLDFRILWMTVSKVLKRDGVSAEGHVTMPKFDGS